MAAETIIQTSKSISSIKGLPLIGNLPEYRKDRLALFLRIAQQCGDVGLLHFGPYPLIMFNPSEYAHSILVEHANDFDKGEFMHNAFRPVIGNGLFVSEGELHRQQRKLMAPSFQPRQIVSYADTMVKYGELIQQEWNDGKIVDVSQEMTHLTMSIIGKVLFDANVFTEADELGRAMSTVLSHVSHNLSSLFPLPFDWPKPHNKHTKQAIAVLRSRIQKMIGERRTVVSRKMTFSLYSYRQEV